MVVHGAKSEHHLIINPYSVGNAEGQIFASCRLHTSGISILESYPGTLELRFWAKTDVRAKPEIPMPVLAVSRRPGMLEDSLQAQEIFVVLPILLPAPLLLLLLLAVFFCRFPELS